MIPSMGELPVSEDSTPLITALPAEVANRAEHIGRWVCVCVRMRMCVWGGEGGGWGG